MGGTSDESESAGVRVCESARWRERERGTAGARERERAWRWKKRHREKVSPMAVSAFTAE